ncbi:putative serine/threonine-protein kinase nek3 [Diplonema papillatum]|nr:putative serine/threonine-protein kinase nek3 [Diplonema papillatum]
MDDYTTVADLGKGAFGSVSLVRRKADDRMFAVKRILQGSLKEREMASREVKVLRDLHHRNIVQYFSSFEVMLLGESSLNIVMEYASGGDLRSKVMETRKAGMSLPEDSIARWFTELLLALRHLHDRNILHRDLKPANIFFTADEVLKLGDFGLTKVLVGTSVAHTLCGTPQFFSPELVRKVPYDHKSDLWSAGCILYEMLMLQHAFTGRSLTQLRRNILAVHYQKMDDGSEGVIQPRYRHELYSLVKMTLVLNPRSRPDAAELLATPLLRETAQMLLAEQAASSQVSSPTTPGSEPSAVRLTPAKAPPEEDTEEGGESGRKLLSSMPAVHEAGSTTPTTLEATDLSWARGQKNASHPVASSRRTSTCDSPPPVADHHWPRTSPCDTPRQPAGDDAVQDTARLPLRGDRPAPTSPLCTPHPSPSPGPAECTARRLSLADDDLVPSNITPSPPPPVAPRPAQPRPSPRGSAPDPQPAAAGGGARPASPIRDQDPAQLRSSPKPRPGGCAPKAQHQQQPRKPEQQLHPQQQQAERALLRAGTGPPDAAGSEDGSSTPLQQALRAMRGPPHRKPVELLPAGRQPRGADPPPPGPSHASAARHGSQPSHASAARHGSQRPPLPLGALKGYQPRPRPTEIQARAPAVPPLNFTRLQATPSLADSASARDPLTSPGGGYNSEDVAWDPNDGLAARPGTAAYAAIKRLRVHYMISEMRRSDQAKEEGAPAAKRPPNAAPRLRRVHKAGGIKAAAFHTASGTTTTSGDPAAEAEPVEADPVRLRASVLLHQLADRNAAE